MDQSDRVRRCALFVDFDNVYIGLREQERQAAEVFATSPRRWLRWLECGNPARGEWDDTTERVRSILVRRCYMNPATGHRYRANFTKAGFSVIDCPSLTSQGKNAADIRMVMDVLDTLEHETRFDEFVILSADSDFTPVLLRLRNHDRRTTILAVGKVALAYTAAADLLLSEETLIEDGLLLDTDAGEPEVRRPEAIATAGDLPMRIIKCITDLVAASDQPVSMAQCAQVVRKEFSDRSLGKNWLGAGSFKALLSSIDHPGFTIDSTVGPGYCFDADRHTLPEPTDRVDHIAEDQPEVAEVAQRISEIIGTPRLTSSEYAALFNAIADEVRVNGYQLTRTSKAVRDLCNERDHKIARSDASFVLKGLVYGGMNLDEHATPRAIGEAFHRNVLELCERVQLDLSKDERDQLEQWILSGLDDGE